LDHNDREVALKKDKVKDLGVWFDEKLSFREHIHVKNSKRTPSFEIPTS